MSGTDRDLDVVVVGAGPAGLAAALVLGRAARPALLVDGGPGRNAPAQAMHGYLGRDGTPPEELRRVAREELDPYPTVRLKAGRVRAISGDQESFLVDLEGGPSVRARGIVLATGVVDELPQIDGVRPLWGRT